MFFFNLIVSTITLTAAALCCNFLHLFCLDSHCTVTSSEQPQAFRCQHPSVYSKLIKCFQVIARTLEDKEQQHFRIVIGSYLIWPELICFPNDQKIRRVNSPGCLHEHTFKKFLSETVKPWLHLCSQNNCGVGACIMNQIAETLGFSESKYETI